MITKEKARQVALEYQKTGFKNKSEALIKAGYKPSYANSGRREFVYKNERVKKEISRLQGKIERKLVITREKQVEKLEEARFLAKRTKNPSGMVSAISEQNKILGYHRDSVYDPNADISENKLTSEELAQLKRLAGLTIHNNKDKQRSKAVS